MTIDYTGRLMRCIAIVVLASGIRLGAEPSHGTYIQALDAEAFQRGEKRYVQTCQICHGTVAEIGALPNSRRFAQEAFKNGSAPHQLFTTVKNGLPPFMPAHPQLSDQEIYDVVHYIREHFLKPHNPTQYVPVDEAYLQQAATMKLAVQTKQQPPWLMMNYGPTMAATYNIHSYSVLKGLAMRLDKGPGGISKGRAWMVFDEDTLQPAAAWDGVFSDYAIITLMGHRVPDDQHQKVGTVRYTMPNQPAWANPETGSFDDLRYIGPDNKRYGPLPFAWGRFEGVHYQRQHPIVQYRVGKRTVLEQYSSPTAGIFQRVIHIGAGDHPLDHRLAPGDAEINIRQSAGLTVTKRDGCFYLHVPAGGAAHVICTVSSTPGADLERLTPNLTDVPDLAAEITQISAPQWAETFTSNVTRHSDDAPFVVDDIAAPTGAPWYCRMRFGGIDFFPDHPDRAAVCTWDGGVWLMDNASTETVTWRRIATGLFQPLGLKIIHGDIYVTCRGQIARLVDSNKDGEIDFVQAFNSDQMVTTHWHEFTSGLIVDPKGFLYYVKAGRHNSPFLVPHHGTCIQVDPDGKASRVIATGFRATNGIGITARGEIFMSDQEGNWKPENMINIIRPNAENPDFFGFAYGYNKLGEKAEDDRYMRKPVLWVNRNVDRSPAALLEVDSPTWGALNGELIAFSYGYGKLFHVIQDEVNGQRQGAYVELPIRYGNNGDYTPAGLMRGRFNPADGQLYTCGLSDWASSRQTPSGMYRVRRTNLPTYAPAAVRVHENGLHIDFPDPLQSVDLKTSALIHWDMLRSKSYGMRTTKFEIPAIPMTRIQLLNDGKSVFVECAMPVTDLYQLTLAYTKADGTSAQILMQGSAFNLRGAFPLPAPAAPNPN